MIYKAVIFNYDSILANTEQAMFTHDNEAAAVNRGTAEDTYDMIPVMLQELTSCGIVLGMISHLSENRIANALNRNNLLQYFSVIVESDSAPRPDPNALLTAIEKLEIDTQETVYVGSSLFDAQLAYHANVDFILLLTGAAAQNEFEQYQYVSAICDLSRLNGFLLGWEYDKYLKQLKYKQDCYDLYSFDIFDTLLYRRCEKPADVFAQVWGIAMKQYPMLELAPSDYVNLRREAEQTAFQKLKPKHKYESIFSEMQLEKGLINFLKRTEIEQEKHVVYLNRSIYSLIQCLYQTGKRIILVSDMYHSESTIRELLEAAGVDLTFIAKVFVSSEYDCYKAEGELFEKALSSLPYAERKRVIHIGDDEAADYYGAKIVGLDSILYGRLSNCRIDRPVQSLIHICEEIQNQGLERTAIFAAGKYGRLFLKLARNCGVFINCFIDNNCTLWNTKIDGIQVSGLDSVSCDCIVVSTIYAQEISEQIESFYKDREKPVIFYMKL